MNMKKVSFLFLTVLFAGKLLLAQNVDEGKKALYYGKLTTATTTLEKAVAANSKNADAIYWLGQAYLQKNPADIAGAKAVYQKALQEGVNAPLVWVGMGHVELLEGKKDEARQRFEAAITNSKTKKGENPEVLNAIGRANADGGSTVGDPAYAIEKLKRAAELDPKNPDIQVNMGINYLKLGNEHGGDAYEAFTNAQRIDPTNAMPNFRLGRIFLSQNNPEKFLEYFNKAVQADPKFAPAYLELYNYYSLRDVNQAREFLDKYVANTDKDCSVDFFSAEYLFRSGKYQESLDKAKAMENGPCKDFPRLKVLYAYNYDRLGDSVQAKNNIDAFMAGATPQNIQPTDYLFAASVSKRVAGGEQAAIGYLTKALENDTVRVNRLQYMDTIAFLYKKTGENDKRLEWLKKSYQLNPQPSDFDLYNLTDAAINAKDFTLADSLANAYVTKRPDQEYGYSLLVRAAKAADVDSTQGSAFPAIDRYITFLSKDTAKNMSKIKAQYYYMAQLASDKKKDYPGAIAILEKVQALDPQDPFATQALPVLRKAVAGPQKSTPAKPATKTSPKKPTTKKG
jgi:tetratricopeptide (TPR) repeat protein